MSDPITPEAMAHLRHSFLLTDALYHVGIALAWLGTLLSYGIHIVVLFWLIYQYSVDLKVEAVAEVGE